MSKKLRWSLNGALVGLAIFLADYFIEWRGQRYLPWTSTEAIASNIGQIIAVIGIAALIGFITGAAADRKKKNR